MKARYMMAGILAFAAVMILMLLAFNAANAGPTVIVGARVPKNQRVDLSKIDHGTWNALLAKYVDQKGLVDYSAWKASAVDGKLLDQYLRQLSSSNGVGTESEKLAFWINAYNAVTIAGILREYPTTSIRNHTAKLVGYNIWKDLHLLVGDSEYSLDQMEHEILRKTGEPRIHFAIVCASIGCPPLRNEAYVAERIDEQLTANAQAFFADASKFTFDESSKSIALSPILDWFGQDFGGTQAEQLRRIVDWLPDESARKLSQSGQARISFLEYDWSLNDKK